MEIPQISSLREKLQTKTVVSIQLLKKAFLRISEREYSRRDLLILFIVAVVVGASFKAWVNDSITIGFDDYKLKESTGSLDLNKIQKELIASGGSLALVEKNVPQGKTCSE